MMRYNVLILILLLGCDGSPTEPVWTVVEPGLRYHEVANREVVAITQTMGSRRVIQKAEIKDAVRELFPSEWYLAYFLDGKYLEYSLSEVMEVVYRSSVSDRPYVSQYYDCDDMAKALEAEMHWELQGIAYGFIAYYVIDWRTRTLWGHAVNIFYDGEELYLIEPADNTVYEYNRLWWLGRIEF